MPEKEINCAYERNIRYIHRRTFTAGRTKERALGSDTNT